MADDTSPWEQLQHDLGYRFQEPALLVEALTHPSYAQQQPGSVPHNQRLEFLGDSTLALILAEALFFALPREREGVLTRNRSVLVKGAYLAGLSRKLQLGHYLRLGEGEAQQGGHDKPSLLEDALEALVGALYLDAGFERTRALVLGWYGDLDAAVAAGLAAHNPKGQLQERVQAHLGHEAIQYDLIEAEGPDHGRRFTVTVSIDGKTCGEGSGTSKKDAEEAAALEALGRWSPEAAEA